MCKLLFLFLVGFLFHTELCAQNDSIQSEKILGHWLLLEIRDTESSVIDMAYGVPEYFTDLKITKKKVKSVFNKESRLGEWKIRGGSILFYFVFDKVKSEYVYKIVSISTTELQLQKNVPMNDGSLKTIVLTYKKK